VELQVRGPYVVLADALMLALAAVNEVDPETEDTPLHAGVKVTV
jgi:hypothetical protein